MTNQSKKVQPHALMFPYPVQGHINPMMQLAKRMMDEGFFITFVNTEYNHQKMFKSRDDAEKLPNLRFEQISDGLPAWHKRLNTESGVLTATVLALAGPLAKLVRRVESCDTSPPLTCIVADAFCTWVQDVADQFCVPRVSLWTTPVHANLAYNFQSTLQSNGLIPVTDKSKLLEVVNCIDGITPMKLEDYISFFLVNSTTDFHYQWHLRLCMKRPEEAAWNLGNNIEELENQAVNAYKKEVPNFLPIGPLLPADILRPTSHNVASIGTSLWPEDEACHDWLSQHDKGSVIYMSFGSVANMSEDELADLILGLEESGTPFLWAVRPSDQVGAAIAQFRARLDSEAAKGNPSRHALVVSWAPQLAVLTHPSVGLFVSHCGWNSLLESIVAGVPILAKAGGFAEQRMNAHYVAEVWKIGLRLPTGASVSCVKTLVRSLIGSSVEAERVRERVAEVQRSALAGLEAPEGPSHSNFRLFIDDMYKRAQLMASYPPHYMTRASSSGIKGWGKGDR